MGLCPAGKNLYSNRTVIYSIIAVEAKSVPTFFKNDLTLVHRNMHSSIIFWLGSNWELYRSMSSNCYFMLWLNAKVCDGGGVCVCCVLYQKMHNN